jgi:hypothetical protein
MGKFIAGFVVGLVTFELAMYHGGWFDKGAIPNGLPDKELPPKRCCQTVLTANQPKINGLKRKTAIV